MVEVTAITVAVVAAGAVLLFAGAALSVYGVALLGAVIGGGGGYMVAPTLGGALGFEGLAATGAGVLVGVVAGVVVAYSLLSVVVAVASFVTGSFVGLFVISPIFVDGAWYVEAGAAIGVGLVCGFLGMVMTKTTLIGVTSFLGSALASLQLTIEDLRTAAEGSSVQPLLWEWSDPLFLGLLVLGVLTQLGLFKFGYVAKVAAILPGASILTDGEDEPQAAGG